MRTATIIAILKVGCEPHKCPIFEILWGLPVWSHSSQNALFLSQSS